MSTLCPRPRTAELTLGRDGLGDAATEKDFGDWVAFVSSHIDDATGFCVAVLERSQKEVQTDAIRVQLDEDRKVIREAIRNLWDEFCAHETV